VVRLAEFVLPNGNRLTFLAENSEAGDFGISELGSCRTKPYFKPDLAATTLDRYLEISPKDAPIPKLLLERCGKSVSYADSIKRDTTDIVRDAIFVAEPNDQSGISNELWHCGNNTSSAFSSDFCFSAGGSNKVEFCDSNAWWFLRRTQENRNRVFSVTAFCDYGGEPDLPFPNNPGQGEIRHLRLEGFIFKDWATTYGNPYSGEGVLHHNWWWWVDWGGNKFDRRVEHNANGGHVRGYTAFYNT
jgi:hypothetical protein